MVRSKIDMRRSLRSAREALSKTEHAARSHAIARIFLQQPIVQRCQCIALYVPVHGEVDCWPIVTALHERGITCCLPRISGANQTLREGPISLPSLETPYAATSGVRGSAPADGARRKISPPPSRLPGRLLEFASVKAAARLAPGAFGIPAPEGPAIPLSDVDLIVVPGVGFSRDGARLGYGGGFYDRTLAQFAGPTIALAFTCQIVAQVPTAQHDKAMDAIITEEGILITCDGDEAARSF